MRTVSYRDVAILLGGKENKLIAALDKVTSGLLLGGVFKFEDLLSWFDAKTDFVRLSHELLGSLSENRRSLRRFSRTQRIEAAHTVIVMTAFFEALGEFDLPLTLKLKADQQQDLFGAEIQTIGWWLIDSSVLPDPTQPYATNTGRVASRYADMCTRLGVLVEALWAWNQLGEVHREKLSAQLRILPERAFARYQDLFRRLVADYPEVACWSNLIEHEATRHEMRASLTGLEQMLADIAAGRSPERRRTALARAYRALLAEPVLAPDDVPPELNLPTVEQAYVNPRFRVREVDRAGNPSRESWWKEVGDAGDIQRFLVGHLTSPRATRAPLVVLGQPGSGKSMLTKVLAARLPATDFMPVRVELRDVPAEADVQEQIEHAVRLATGERVQWPDLAQAAGDALPVILLDGFDELLQATGVHQTDYLAKVSQFQKREADQERPVAVVVTTRTAVADLARFPEESVALRLEPFDDNQIKLWVGTWNSVNTDVALDADSVLTYSELAEQPLLLLMLALYDADGNALRNEGPISRSALYERLLMRFAYREVAKHCPGHRDEEVARRAELELRRLSVVAFAMFNRGTQWITQDVLNEDLAALGAAGQADSTGMRRSLSGAELAIGRFFFIHRARAQQAGKQISTYEFLHATFGEYLVARMTWHEIRVVAAKANVADVSIFEQGLVDDSALYAFLSFAPLASRGPVVTFLIQMADQLSTDGRKEIAAVLIRLFRTAHDPRRERGRSRYEPLSLSVPRRHAAYSANLVIVITALLGRVRGSQLFGTREDVVVHWMREALLWRSQLAYYDMIDNLALRRIWHENERDIELRLGVADRGVVDPQWSHPNELLPGSKKLHWTFYREATITKRQNFFCSPGDDHLVHLLEPVMKYVGDATNMYVAFDATEHRALGNVLLQALLSPVKESTKAARSLTYLWCAHLLDGHQLKLVIDRIRTDADVPADVIVEILEDCLAKQQVPVEPLLRCAMATLGRDRTMDQRLLRVVDRLLIGLGGAVGLLLECQLRLFDLDYHQREPFTAEEWQRTSREFIESGQRPDLAKRARWMWNELGS